MDTKPPDLIPVRMLNEFTYCPRLAYMEWVQNEFRENVYVVEGKSDHRRVDRPSRVKRYSDVRTEAEEKGAFVHGRSVKLSAPKYGLIGVIDIVEEKDGYVVPIDYKHGDRPDIPGGVWDTDLIQLGAQALLLEENGYRCEEGVVYYCGSKLRESVPITDHLKARTIETIRNMWKMVDDGQIPPPLDDNPKCPKCSLVTICLPDETHLLELSPEEKKEHHPIRKIAPHSTDRIPLYVHSQGSRIGKKGDCLIIRQKGKPDVSIRMMDTSQVAIFGGIQITTPTINSLCRQGIPVCYFSHGGWFYGMTTGLGHKNVDLRMHQYQTASDEKKALKLAKQFVSGKIRNSRTMIRRNVNDNPENVLKSLKFEIERATNAKDSETLLGYEGNAARIYFGSFEKMLKQNTENDAELKFKFEQRNRRPPKDPINAMLSFAYSLLTKEMTVILQSVGFDPYLGFYHSVKYGRPALALDMIEEFRPIIADSVVIGVVNNGVITPKDFIYAGGAVNLTESGRKKFLQAYERRLDQTVTHPIFKYKVNYRQIFELQARLLGRFISGEIPEYPTFLVR